MRIKRRSRLAPSPRGLWPPASALRWARACYSKSESDSRETKMFRFGVSFGRNDLNLEGHLQMGYNSKTVNILIISPLF